MTTNRNLWSQAIASFLSIVWGGFVFALSVSWSHRFVDFINQPLFLIVPLSLVLMLGFMPISLWQGYCARKEIILLVVACLILFGAILVWLIYLSANYEHPKGWTCNEQDSMYIPSLFIFSIMASFLLVIALSQSQTTSGQDNLIFLLTHVSILSLYSTPWIAGLHCGTFFYEGSYVMRGLLILFMLICSPALLFLNLIALPKWRQFSWLTKLVMVNSFVIGAGSIALCYTLVILVTIS
ncbi:MAG: hypothetical protein DPW16_13435 [Chloroflexi bacterium]|nr:hypothetical protein [Chloroflexota bacterium]